ncbi:MAG: SMC-Scp complex subunit ScpB [Candidatus Omnitrophica bacterium]|nr:SMC-Scp complex subunit ScpB [Candidatus Omnitrophota bacterium]
MTDPKTKTQQKTNSSDNVKLDDESMKRVIEAVIFASDKPLPLQQIKDILGDVDTRVIRRLINELKDEYAQGQRSFGITEVAGGFQFSTDPAYGRWLKRLYNVKQSDYLTGPSLETLSIIAYKQPVTKADMEYIRGVSVDGVISNLLQKGLIKIAGKKDVIGRPFLYATTKLFLQYFGLNAVNELPALPEFREADLKFKNREEERPVENVEAERPAENTEADSGSEAPNNIGEAKDEEPKEVTQEDRSDR